MENRSNSLFDVQGVRVLLLILANMLLNFGLFFILNFLAPLLAGFIIGYILAKYTDTLVASATGTALSYFMVFLISEWFLGFVSNPIDVLLAVVIMCSIGVFGGLIGAALGSRRLKSS